MGRRGWMIAAAAAAAMLGLAGCTGSPEPGGASGEESTPPETGAPPASSAPPASGTPIPAPWDAFVGTWGDPDGPHLVIGADGRFSGSDGCNRMGGRWDPEDDGGIEFDDVFMTKRYCEGVDDSLNRLDEATLDGDTLTVLGDDDAVITTLPRTA